MVPKHLRKSNESIAGDQETLMTSLYGLQGRMKNDKSILRQPIDTSVRGVKDLIKAVVGGTQELQELLLNECMIIYECKMCRNLFRSLVNFISHKRIYCMKNSAFFPEETTKQEDELFEHDNQEDPGMKCSDEASLSRAEVWLSSNKVVPNNVKLEENNHLKPTRRIKISPFKISGKCDIARIADGLNQRGRKDSNSKSLDDPPASVLSHADVTDKLVKKNCQQHLKISQTEGVNFINNLYENEKKRNSNECSKPSQSQTVEKIPSYNEAVLQENGKFRVTPHGIKVEDRENLENYKCTICNTHFLHTQTLTRHVQIHHKERICYPCPICRTFFPSPTSTYRHLSKDHHKTEQQIRRLRPKILAKASKRKLTDSHHTGKEKTGTSQRLNGNWEGGLRCSVCGKLFNRQAVLRVHSITCKEKNSSTEKPNSSPKTHGSNIDNVALVSDRPVQQKSGILVRRDYFKKSGSDAVRKLALTNQSRENRAYKGQSLKRINKWRTVLKKLQRKNGLPYNEASSVTTD